MNTEAMSSQQAWVEVCDASDIVPGTGAAARVADTQIAVFNTRGGWYAIANHDPFSDANVLARGIVGDLNGKLVVASPVYKQHFCLQTGNCLEDETVSLPVYPVSLEQGRVRVCIER